ncbi:Hypothetical protein MVR_LOCUS213 [uncultured virus]|nr:Hypothetical protein MVR_LOCUS213 [uncultured virus]
MTSAYMITTAFVIDYYKITKSTFNLVIIDSDDGDVAVVTLISCIDRVIDIAKSYDGGRSWYLMVAYLQNASPSIIVDYLVTVGIGSSSDDGDCVNSNHRRAAPCVGNVSSKLIIELTNAQSQHKPINLNKHSPSQVASWSSVSSSHLLKHKFNDSYLFIDRVVHDLGILVDDEVVVILTKGCLVPCCNSITVQVTDPCTLDVCHENPCVASIPIHDAGVFTVTFKLDNQLTVEVAAVDLSCNGLVHTTCIGMN